MTDPRYEIHHIKVTITGDNVAEGVATCNDGTPLEFRARRTGASRSQIKVRITSNYIPLTSPPRAFALSRTLREMGIYKIMEENARD